VPRRHDPPGPALSYAPPVPREAHEQNRRSWNLVIPAHDSHKRDQAAFLRAGGHTLFPDELDLLGVDIGTWPENHVPADMSRETAPLAGLDLLHLQCNVGQDTLSLARLGARVTGVDISDEAIARATQPSPPPPTSPRNSSAPTSTTSSPTPPPASTSPSPPTAPSPGSPTSTNGCSSTTCAQPTSPPQRWRPAQKAASPHPFHPAWRALPVRERAPGDVYNACKRAHAAATSTSSDLARQPRERQDPTPRPRATSRRASSASSSASASAMMADGRTARRLARRELPASPTSRWAWSPASSPSTFPSWSPCGCCRRPSWPATPSSSSRARSCPYGAMKLAVLLQEAGLPDGIFNIVNGAQRRGRGPLSTTRRSRRWPSSAAPRSPRSSTPRGAATGKRMLCLGGAKNHLIVVPDADVALTAENIVASASTAAPASAAWPSSLDGAVGDCDR
jgi:hypothetical protein